MTNVENVRYCSSPTSSNLQLWALVNSFPYHCLQSSPLYSLWRSLAINRQESYTTKDNANALVSSNQSLSWDIYSFLEKALPGGDTSNTARAEWRRVMMCLLEIAAPAFEVMQNAVSALVLCGFSLTLIQPGRLTDDMFSFKEVARRGLYKWREHLTHLKWCPVQPLPCTVDLSVEPCGGEWVPKGKASVVFFLFFFTVDKVH